MRIGLLGFCLLIVSTLAPGAASAQASPDVRYHGVLIRVPDLVAARQFYVGTLGFGAERFAPRMLRLTGETPIFLEQVEYTLRAPAEDEARASIAFQTHDIETVAERLRARGIAFFTETPIRVGVGLALRFLDPFGNIHALLQQTIAPTAPFTEPHVYNTGLKHPDEVTPALRSIFGRLGFVVRTERYFPPSLPYGHADGSFAFMLHENEVGEPEVRDRSDPLAAPVSLIFVTDDIASVRALLSRDLPTEEAPFPFGQRLRVTLPSGIPVEFWPRSDSASEAKHLVAATAPG